MRLGAIATSAAMTLALFSSCSEGADQCRRYSVFLAPDSTEANVRVAQTELRSAAVSEVTITSQEEGLEELQRRTPGIEATASDLPYRLRATVEERKGEKFERIAADNKGRDVQFDPVSC